MILEKVFKKLIIEIISCLFIGRNGIIKTIPMIVK